MKKHSHNHIETYNGLAGLGLDRETDENTIIYYLQKFSDDTLIKELVKRLTTKEIEEIFFLLTRLLKKHLTDSEYHTLFLKDNHP
ncbi:MAG: cytoplasmic protein [Deltaproteobacteria bacterium]|nr:cytoplasmic protein [Deltaproteobacteria bacterium]MBW1957912.1 cytoplasmic protein [Deltaproteobacteria bacterium]MBW2012642.1 cytoplasmic protein [Deltaproteobacteria bacterium]MBW2087609.1 cytoplasmic protein [Deltaproteobacteria bacterium]MBW2319301.1 cytoplasmic protein [Deltaproteobacteria bacterium]